MIDSFNSQIQRSIIVATNAQVLPQIQASLRTLNERRTQSAGNRSIDWNPNKRRLVQDEVYLHYYTLHTIRDKKGHQSKVHVLKN